VAHYRPGELPPRLGSIGNLGFTSAITDAAAGGGTSSGPIGTLVGAGVAAVAALIPVIVNLFKGCGATCTAATRIVDQAEGYLKQNVAAYQAGPHTRSSQALALSTFDQLWTQVLQGCSNPALADAGRRCISERSRGGKWDWFVYYRDPIANDTRVVPDPAVASSTLASIGIDPNSGVGQFLNSSSVPGIPNAYLLAGAAGLVFLLAASGDK
jgi:hypothetical protein